MTTDLSLDITYAMKYTNINSTSNNDNDIDYFHQVEIQRMAMIFK